MHCEGIMSGELKHGPLAMVDKNRSIVMIICSDNVYKVSFIYSNMTIPASFASFNLLCFCLYCLIQMFSTMYLELCAGLSYFVDTHKHLPQKTISERFLG